MGDEQEAVSEARSAPPERIKLGGICGMGLERMADELRARTMILDVANHLEEWSPLRSRGQPPVLPDRGTVKRLMKNEHVDLPEEAKREIISAYTEWVRENTWIEQQNVARLGGLLWAVRATETLLERFPGTAEFEVARSGMLAILRNQWRVEDVPPTCCESALLAESIHRNLRALPMEWRDLW
jgi:hypothetical protein